MPLFLNQNYLTCEVIAMASFIGHGVLAPYNFEIPMSKSKTFESILEEMPVPKSLRTGLIAVRGTQSLQKEDEIFPEDTIHLYFVICGG